MAEAADAAPAILTHAPTACEGLDRRIVDVVARTRGAAAVPPLPRGDGWVLVELAGDNHAQLQARAERLLAEAAALDGRVVSDPVQSLALWKIREDGAGLAGVSLSRPAYPGWEDAAVPPASLGAYLRDFDKLLADHGLEGLPYGHFGDGCVHVRIDFPLTEPWRPRPVPALRRGGGAAGGWLRRVDVWRTWRRPRPLGPAGHDVLGIRP